MPLAALPYLILCFGMGIILTADLGRLGTKMLERLRHQRVMGFRIYRALPDWTIRVLGVWALIWGVASIFIIDAVG